MFGLLGFLGPVAQIDHVLVSDDWAVDRDRDAEIDGTDHRRSSRRWPTVTARLAEAPTPSAVRWGAMTRPSTSITPPRRRCSRSAVDAMTAHLRDVGNPSSLHASGRQARRVVEESRETIAQALNCRPGEVVFTSGGTEADNLALKGIYWARRGR